MSKVSPSKYDPVGGIFGALDAIQEATGVEQVNAIGYCIGSVVNPPSANKYYHYTNTEVPGSYVKG